MLKSVPEVDDANDCDEFVCPLKEVTPPPPEPQFTPVEVSIPEETSIQPLARAVVIDPTNVGVVMVGDVLNTRFPVPVSSVRIERSLVEVSTDEVAKLPLPLSKPREDVATHTTPVPVDCNTEPFTPTEPRLSVNDPVTEKAPVSNEDSSDKRMSPICSDALSCVRSFCLRNSEAETYLVVSGVARKSGLVKYLLIMVSGCVM
jgi:hypothetical protein